MSAMHNQYQDEVSLWPHKSVQEVWRVPGSQQTGEGGHDLLPGPMPQADAVRPQVQQALPPGGLLHGGDLQEEGEDQLPLQEEEGRVQVQPGKWEGKLSCL